ncbi:PEP-CTERM sorting domain-containing protein [Chlorogloeopsis sp. ULAP02]|uniref:PEP-CTERM sorting domain-containing protein n=1 Tax=Chlorogloeopsis sp. ULAP02 TaxID=3107926 RepID=UPI0031347BAF
MLNATSKKLSQLAATAVLGATMLGAVGTAPVSAASITAFNISGQFAPEAVTGSVGLPTLLGGGYFKGTYEVDTDKLPDNGPGVFLQNWEVSLFDSSNNFVKKFSKSIPNNSAFVQTNALRFTEADFTPPPSFSVLSVVFPPGFKGEGKIQGGFQDYNPFDGSFGSIAIVSGKSEPVPEPITIAGTAVAGAMGLWMKRKQQKAKAS